MRRFAWTRILAVLLVLCMVASVVSMGVPAALAERVTINEGTNDEYQLEYFPVTLYDYDKDTINAVTHQLEVNAGLGDEWKGMYFSGGDPAAESFTYATSADSHTDLTWAQVMNGTYYSNEACTTKVTVETVTEGESTYSATTVTYDYWGNYSSYENKGYYYKNGNSYELITSLDCSEDWWNDTYEWDIVTSLGTYTYSSSSSRLTIYQQTTTATPVGYTLKAGSTTLATLNSTDTSAKVGVTLYTAAGTATTDTLPYADHNWWNKNSGSNDNGQKTYTGLVASQLDANKNIVFNVPDAGLFTSDPVNGKTVYQNVKLPFFYDSEKNIYTFDAGTYGVYFLDDDEQGTSGTPASNSKLYFDKSGPQIPSGCSWGDGSSTVWAPFDGGKTLTGQYSTVNNMNYWFGMSATIPFTMTANGKMNAADENSDDITFDFSGDDDVWIFVDGYLVADLGGIHNRLDVTINFADNTVTYSESNAATAVTGSYNDAEFALVQSLFNTDSATGLIPQDRTTFAAKDNHELTIYYMERGAGSSNSKIWFNLPVKDTLSVQKLVNKKVEVNDAKTALDMSTVTALDADQQTVIDNLNFGFTAYKNGVAMANTTYNLLNANGQVIANPSTDASGHFYLKNGQTAKFTGEFSTSGDEYYVVEDVKDGFIYTTYNATANAQAGTSIPTAATTYTYFTIDAENGNNAITNKSVVLQSATYKVVGGADTEDSLNIVCENYVNASLPTPSAIPNDDKFVLDFGLSAELEIFSNDLFIGSNPTISFESYTGKYGTFTYADGKITYTLNKQMTGVEVIPYTLTVTAQGNDGGTYSATGTANIYIMPATSMYYEENFGTLVTFKPGTSGGWTQVGTSQTAPQEPGKVGTSDDSPYGSDKAYLNDSGDSNGSSMYVDTTNGAAQFVYTFTGTGTSFFARTSDNTAYLRIRVYDANDKAVYASYLDTVYKTSDTLYNIPVFTWNAVDAGLGYGEYKVEVTVAKLTTKTWCVGDDLLPIEDCDGEGCGHTKKTQTLYHSDFWLDGIRVFEPLNSADANYKIAQAAYATDEEANMTVVTLRDKILGEGDFVEAVDEDGNIIYETDENGNIVYETDEEGNLIRDDAGNPIPVPVMVPVFNAGQDDFILFTDTDGALDTYEEYEDIGPKEEVYLYNKQSISFALVDWDANTYDIYLGIKAPTGSGTVVIGSTQLTISNAADCYYNISDYGAIVDATVDGKAVKVVTFDISAGEGSLISLTNIKVTGDAVFTVINNVDIVISGANGGN